LVALPEQMFDLEPDDLAKSIDMELDRADAGRAMVYDGMKDRSWPVVAKRTAELYHNAKENRERLAPE
jgi:hypothetical protein